MIWQHCYDLFRTPQPKGETKVWYHARSVVTDKMKTRELIHTIARQSLFKDDDYITTKELQIFSG